MISGNVRAALLPVQALPVLLPAHLLAARLAARKVLATNLPTPAILQPRTALLTAAARVVAATALGAAKQQLKGRNASAG